MRRKQAAQVPFAKKAAAMTAANGDTPPPSPNLVDAELKRRVSAAPGPQTSPYGVEHDRAYAARRSPGVRLMSKPDVLDLTGVSYPTIWSWMRAGRFPRSRIVGGKSMWLSSEVETWLRELPVRPLKGDAPSNTPESRA